MAKQWTPPTDGKIKKEEVWTPPTNALEVKKKEETLVSDGEDQEDTISLDTEERAVTEPSDSSSLMEDEKKEPSLRAKYAEATQGALTGFPGREDEEYRKVDGQWMVKTRSTEFVTEKGIPTPGTLEGGGLQLEEVVRWESIDDTKGIDDLEKHFFEKDVETEDYKSKRDLEINRRKITSSINNSLVGENEESVVPQLQKMFKEAGGDADLFTVEEAGAGYNALTITNNDTGESRFVNLSNFSGDRNSVEAEVLRSFVDFSIRTADYGRLLAKREELEKDIFLTEDIKERLSKGEELEELESLLTAEEEKQVILLKEHPELGSGMSNASSVNNIKYEIEDLKSKGRDVKIQAIDDAEWMNPIIESYNKGEIPEDEWQNEWLPKIIASQKEYKALVTSLEQDQERLIGKSDRLQTAAATNYLLQKERGNLVSGATRSFVKGSGTVFQFIGGDNTIDKFGRTYSERFADKFAPGFATKEFMTSEDRSMFEQVVFGLSESVGASLTGAVFTAGAGSGLGSTMGFFANSYEHSRDQMSSPEFKDIPEYQKILFAGTMGVITGALERYGITKAFSNKPVGKKFTGYILSKVFESVPKKASSEVIEKAINENIKIALANGIIKITAAGVVEASTELGQESSDIALKAAFNSMKGKNYFDSPKTAMEILDRLGQSAMGGLMGGAMMSTAHQAGTISTTGFKKNGFDGIGYDVLESMATDPILRDLYTSDLDIKVINGEITQDEADTRLNELDQVSGQMKKIPNDMSLDNKTKAFDLIMERDIIEKQIEGQDPNLVQDKKARIESINTELQELAVPKGESEAGAVAASEEIESKRQEELTTLKEKIEKDTEGKIDAELEKKIINDKYNDMQSKLPTVTEPELKTEKDAIQKQAAGKIPVEPKAAISEEVVKRAPKPKPEVVTKEGVEVKEEIEEPDSFKSAVTKGTESAISWLDDVDKQVDDFSKETLGVNVPIIVAKAAITAAKVAAKTTNEVSKIVDAAITEVRNSDWYKDLSKKDKKKAEAKAKLIFTSPKKFEASRHVETAKEKYDLSVKRGNDKQQAYESALGDLQKTKWYERASDVIREYAVRELRSELGIKEKRAPSLQKLGLVPKAKKITINEKTYLKKQIQLENRAARIGMKSERDARKAVAKRIKDEMKAAKGRFSERQINAITQRALNMNLSNPVMAERFVDYVSKVIEDANYSSKLQTAFTIRKNIKSKAKQKTQDFRLAGMGVEFSKINPTYVEDIDGYLEAAKSVEASLTKSKAVRETATFRDTADIVKVAEYTEKAIEKQDQIQKDVLKSEYSELFDSGVLDMKMSLEDMKTTLKDIFGIQLNRVDKTKLDKQVKSAFEVYSGIIETMIETGVDPFTGSDISLDEKQIKSIKSIIGLDISKLDVKQILELVDMMSNFAVNGGTGRIVAVAEHLIGIENGDKAYEKIGRVSDTWRINRMYQESFGSIPLMLENLFGGVDKALIFQKLSGFTEFIIGANKGEHMAEAIQEEYSNKFRKQKANGDRFNSAKNTYERGMYAFLSRTKLGSDSEMIAEFKRRVQLLNETVEYLTGEDATKDEARAGKLYKELAEKFRLGDPELTIADIDNIVDSTNKEAAQWWIDKWGEHYQDLSRISEDVYNKSLGSDLNYTPDSFTKRDSVSETIEGAMQEAAIGYGNYVHDKESGVLMDTRRVKKLPKDRFINLDFDISNGNKIKNALVDLNTAASTQKLRGFLSSKGFKSMIGGKERKLVEGRMLRYILTKRVGRSLDPKTESAQTRDKIMNLSAKAGVGYVLAGTEQIPKQTISVAANTLANAGFHFNPKDAFNLDIVKWIAESGAPISRRGSESTSAIERAEKNISKYSGDVKAAVDLLNKPTDLYLKHFLINPDKRIAIASFVAFYKKNFAKRGLSTEIDYTKPMDIDALAFAQHMVDRQQVVSDPDMAGEFWIKESTAPFKKLFFALATFAMNQKVRTYTDLKVLTSKGSNADDRVRAIRSLIGTGVELIVFQSIGMMIRSLYKDIIERFVGFDPEEDDPYVSKRVDLENKRLIAKGEEAMNPEDEVKFRALEVAKRKKETETKTAVTSVIKDFFSPMPILDDVVVKAFNFASEKIAKKTSMDTKEIDEAVEYENNRREEKGEEPLDESEELSMREELSAENAFKAWDFKEKSFSGLFGTPGIIFDKIVEFEPMTTAATEGIIEKEVFGRKTKKYLLPKHQELAKINMTINSMFLLRLMPSDIGKMSRYAHKRIEKVAFTKNQMGEYEEVFKERTGSEAKREKLREEIANKPDVVTIEEERLLRRGRKHYEILYP